MSAESHSQEPADPAKHPDISQAMDEVHSFAPSMSRDELYFFLKQTARQVLYRRGTPTHTLVPTALVHEFLLWVMKKGFTNDKNANAKLASRVACKMCDVLHDYDRYHNRHHAARRSSRQNPIHENDSSDDETKPVPLELRDHSDANAIRIPDLHRLRDLVSELDTIDREAAAAVSMRFFLNMTNVDIAKALDCSENTVLNYLARAKQWLRDRAK